MMQEAVEVKCIVRNHERLKNERYFKPALRVRLEGSDYYICAFHLFVFVYVASSEAGYEGGGISIVVRNESNMDDFDRKMLELGVYHCKVDEMGEPCGGLVEIGVAGEDRSLIGASCFRHFVFALLGFLSVNYIHHGVEDVPNAMYIDDLEFFDFSSRKDD